MTGITRSRDSRLAVAHYGPEKTNEFACDGDHGHLRWLVRREAMVAFVQAMLRFPRVCDDGGRLTALARGEGNADLRRTPVAPGRLHQDMAAVAVSRLRDGATA